MQEQPSTDTVTTGNSVHDQPGDAHGGCPPVGTEEEKKEDIGTCSEDTVGCARATCAWGRCINEKREEERRRRKEEEEEKNKQKLLSKEDERSKKESYTRRWVLGSDVYMWVRACVRAWLCATCISLPGHLFPRLEAENTIGVSAALIGGFSLTLLGEAKEMDLFNQVFSC